MSYLAHAHAVADLDDLVMTHELASRPARTPDHAAENRAMAELAQELVRHPDGVPGRVEEMLRALCRCGAAGTGLPEQHGVGVDWHSAGSEPVLLRDPARLFPSLRAAGPAPAEMLLLPWAVDGGPAGMLWVADPERRFDLEDARLLRSLSGFAAAALRLASETAQRTATERELHASHAILDAAMHTEAVGLAFYTLDGSIIDCNEALERMSGYSRDELRGTVRWTELGTPEFAEATQRALAELREGGRTAPYMKQLVRKDGSRWWAMVAPSCLPGEGEARKCIAFVIDVTKAAQAEEALRCADRRKDEFLATLAHELRNPLAPISNAVHLLRRPDGRRTADRMVEMVGRQVRQMVRLVDDLMDVSRITQGKLELRREQLSLAEVLTMAVETSMPAIEAGRHDLTVSLPEETLMLEADKVRLTQVFGNLLNNAAKYTDRGGRIWLGARREDGSVLVSIRDTGIGISAAKLPRVFEMFSQAHRDSARGQAGLGIGLTMVRSLVELHRGSVEARSEGPGRGSEFIVRLPLAQVNAAAPHLDAAGSEAPLEGRRVLVVDDNSDAAESLALLLQSAGAEVHTANDGPAGLAAVRRFLPHAVLLDLGMPGMDGFEVARRLRAEPGLAGLVLVALTGWGQEEDRKRTRSSGFDHHLTKPVDVDRLMDILGKTRPGAVKVA